MEGLPTQNKIAEISDQEMVTQQRITYAKNMIQIQLALKKGFDGSDESKNPEHFVEKYNQAFRELVNNNPSIIDDFYAHQDDLGPLLERVENELENVLPPYYKQ